MADCIDARGLTCPQPVEMNKTRHAGSPATCEVHVDNPTAKENVTRFAEHAGYHVTAATEGGDYRLTLTL